MTRAGQLYFNLFPCQILVNKKFIIVKNSIVLSMLTLLQVDNNLSTQVLLKYTILIAYRLDMHSHIYFYKVTCPECGTVHYGFIGDSEDGSFYCDAKIEVKKGKNTRTEECGYSIEKIGHLPEKSYENIAIIRIKDSKPDIEYIKTEE